MVQLYQDAISIVRQLGKPDLFITITCNPNWPEITRELLPGQTPNDRNDIVVRVFKLKRDAICRDIFKNGIFGKVVGYVRSDEFQKRGLPHSHLLIILDQADKPSSTADYDSIVSAQLPDPETEPILFKSVSQHMMHGPCGPGFPDASCMKERCKGGPKECSKG